MIVRTQDKGAPPRGRTKSPSHWRAVAIDIVTAGMLAAALLPLSARLAGAQPGVIHVSGADRTATIYLPAGKSQDVRTDEGFKDITVGDPTIADVNPLTDHSLSILGKKIGTTRVSVYDADKKLVGIVDVEVGYDTARIAAEFKRRFPEARLKVSSINGRLMLTGEAPDAPTVDQAVAVAKQFSPDVINSISVASPQQVMLEVRFIEITRQAGRDLGVQWNVFSHGSTTNIGSGQPAGNLPLPAPTSTSQLGVGEVAAGVLSGASPYGVALARMINGGTVTDLIINALEQKGVARSLAEPNLVALSGDTASFLAGGEYPIPVPGGALGSVSIEYKRYGVGLAFTPTVLKRHLINLKIEPEVSQFDPSHSVQLAGLTVPSLIVRRASTTVELRDGQSFVIGGLLQNVNTTDQQQLPWLGDVPVLGALFRSASYQKNETDLVIIVTPRLMRPARPGDSIKTPLDATLPPNDADLFLAGKNEIPRKAARIAYGAELPLTGHIIDLPKRGEHVAE